MNRADVVILGAGAAGLAAAIFAAENAPAGSRILLVEGAKKPGAKILVSGGGRCNVTHEVVTERDYWGGSPNTIRKVLKAFPVSRTLEWMSELGISLKLEETGKYFPVSNSARSVLEGLLKRAEKLGVEIRTVYRVRGIQANADGSWLLRGPGDDQLVARYALVIATGGLALPKSGSDGAGLAWLRDMGYQVVPTTPGLVPLVLTPRTKPPALSLNARYSELAGVTVPLSIVLRDATGRLLARETGSTLFTHFGLSGPAPMNLSRCIARYRLENPGKPYEVSLSHPRFENQESALSWVRGVEGGRGKRQVFTVLEELFPERLARAWAEGLDCRFYELTRQQRVELASRLSRLPVEVVGDRGYSFAEVTAGGVDLKQVDPGSMESRLHPGLFLCGEILDVDGRIGGFNFQWAWATGYLAGKGAAGKAFSSA